MVSQQHKEFRNNNAGCPVKIEEIKGNGTVQKRVYRVYD
jgi:hypothetical protein